MKNRIAPVHPNSRVESYAHSRSQSVGVLIAGFLLLFSLIAASGFASPFPTTFTLDSLHKADKNPKALDGKIIAFRGTITTMKALADGRPYFFVQFVNPNPNKEGIWVSGFTNIQPGTLLVGHNIAVLAYFELIKGKDKVISALHKKTYHAAGFCIANATTQTGMYATEGTTLCTEWQNGTIPVAEAESTKVRTTAPEIKVNPEVKKK